MGVRICLDGHRVAGRLRHHCANLGGKIRAACCVAKLYRPATDVFIGGFLYDPVVASTLAGIIVSESVFLHGRRVSLRLLSRLGCFTLPQPWDSDGMFPGSIVVDIANAENRVQNPKMIRSTTSGFTFHYSLNP